MQSFEKKLKNLFRKKTKRLFHRDPVADWQKIVITFFVFLIGTSIAQGYYFYYVRNTVFGTFEAQGVSSINRQDLKATIDYYKAQDEKFGQNVSSVTIDPEVGD